MFVRGLIGCLGISFSFERMAYNFFRIFGEVIKFVKEGVERVLYWKIEFVC